MDDDKNVTTVATDAVYETTTVKMDTCPIYECPVKIDTNPAYAATNF